MPSDRHSACCAPARATKKTDPQPAIQRISADAETLSERLVPIPGGRALVGTKTPFFPGDGEGPERAVSLKPFHIGPHTVTNAWFAEFVAATDYRTDAERFGWSLVLKNFAPKDPDAQFIMDTPWWQKVPGADWAHPFGPESSIESIRDHPVVHVSWRDATAFAEWAGGRLPTEAEWEHAAKGGVADARFPWGEKEPTDEQPLCNIWQGDFPDHNTGRDGHLGTAPVRSFAPNPFGLYNMSGNVWEWCADTFRIRSSSKRARLANQSALAANMRVLKGGSYMCHKSYCYRYRIAARTGTTADTSTGHTGFRIAL